MEASACTIPGAAGWFRGFISGEHRADYFFRNDRPKKLWLRPLNRHAGTMLCNIEMPPEYAAGLNLNSPERALPLRAAQMETKKEGELTCARRLYATTPLHGATVTGDALNCEPQSITLVVENGGDVLFQLKPNQPTALQHAMEVAAKLPPFLPANRTNCRNTGARNGGFTRSMQ